MRTSSMFFILFIALISVKAYSQNQVTNLDTLIKVQNKKIDQLNDILINQDSIIKSLQKNFDSVQKRVGKIKISDLDSTVRVITVIVAILTLLYAILFGYLTWFNYTKTKDVENTIKDSRKTIDDNNEKFNRSFIYYQDKYDRISKEFKQEFIDTLQQLKQASSSSIEEITQISKKVQISKIEVENLNNEIKSHRSYLKESIELLFDLLLVSANIIQDKKFYSQIFVKRAVSLLYSFDEKERFTGITTLNAVGTLAEVKHLEHILLNKDETDTNIILANKAITEIITRQKR